MNAFENSPKVELHPYQQRMVDFALQRLYVKGEKGVGFFADLGTGKTAACLKTLATLKELGELGRVLVVAPLRVIYNTWTDEISKWTPGLVVYNLHQYKSGIKYPAPNTDIDLINPDSLHKLIDHAGRWDTLIIDESSQFKRWTTRRFKAIRKMLPNFSRRIIMTGTPTPESLIELHSQAYILDDGKALGKNVTVFRARFCDRGGWKGRQWLLRKGVEKELLDLVAPMVIRVDAASNLDMPALVENDIWCSLPAEVAAQYRTLKRELALELEQGSLLVGNAAALYGKLKQLCNGMLYYTDEETEVRYSTEIHREKLHALEDIKSELCGKHAIVLYQFTHDVGPIISALEDDCAFIGGDTHAKESEKIIRRWNERKIRFLVSHSRCLSHGLNLQAGGADMIFFGLPDSCEGYLQARARLWRQGQKEQVRVHRILVKGTVEELQLARLEGKIKGQDDFLAALKAHARV